MAEFCLTPYQSDLRATWDSVVCLSKNGNFLHLRDYMGYHAHRFNEQSLIIYKQGKPVAVFPCNQIEERAVSHGGLTYGGLIYSNEVRAVDVLEIFRHLAEYYRVLGCRLLTYKAIPHIFHRYPAEEDSYALFRMGARLVRRDLSTTVQLSGRMKLSDSRKNTVRKAQKQGVAIREGNFFDAFHGLLAAALIKFGAHPVHSPEELHLLHSRFSDRIRLFGAFAGDQLLAGALIYDFGNVVHSQYLASSDEGQAVGALDFVLAHLMDDVFSQRQFFNFGISTERGGLHLNEGLIFQKEGFGGRGIVHDTYEMAL